MTTESSAQTFELTRPVLVNSGPGPSQLRLKAGDLVQARGPAANTDYLIALWALRLPVGHWERLGPHATVPRNALTATRHKPFSPGALRYPASVEIDGRHDCMPPPAGPKPEPAAPPARESLDAAALEDVRHFLWAVERALGAAHVLGSRDAGIGNREVKDAVARAALQTAVRSLRLVGLTHDRIAELVRDAYTQPRTATTADPQPTRNP